jgi:hypothetical protein
MCGTTAYDGAMVANASQSLDSARRELESRRDYLSKQIEEIDRAMDGIDFARALLGGTNGHTVPAPTRLTAKSERRERPVPAEIDTALRQLISGQTGEFSTTNLVLSLAEPPFNLRMRERDRDVVTRALRKYEEEKFVANVQRGQGRRPAMWRRAK